ncbi:Cytoskeleton-associated protein [Neofusicoccum parvum]|nr:Cytoskeleton-associated protein [Neofusicoccum parvum]
MSLTISDRVLWLGIGAGIYALIRAVSYGLHDVYNLTEVAPAPDSPRAVAQGTEDDIPLPSLQVLATQHPNLEIRKAATAIVTTRVLNDPTTIRRILADFKKPDGAPDQRSARNAIQLIRSTNGIDLEDWEEDHAHDDDDDDTAAVAAVAATAEAGFDAITAGRHHHHRHHGSGGGRTRSTTDMRREMASRYWAVEHVNDDGWDAASDDNSHAADVSSSSPSSASDSDHEEEEEDLTITVSRGGQQLATAGASVTAPSSPQASRRGGEFDALLEADVASLFSDLGRPEQATSSVDARVEAIYGTFPAAATTNASARENGEIVTVWDRHRGAFAESRRAHGLREQGGRRRGENSSHHVVDGVARPHGRRLRARSGRESEEEVARRRVRREAVVVNDGDRPISQEDIIQRPLQRRSY